MWCAAPNNINMIFSFLKKGKKAQYGKKKTLRGKSSIQIVNWDNSGNCFWTVFGAMSLSIFSFIPPIQTSLTDITHCSTRQGQMATNSPEMCCNAVATPHMCGWYPGWGRITFEGVSGAFVSVKCSAFYMAPKVIGLFAAQPFHGQVCATPYFIYKE